MCASFFGQKWLDLIECGDKELCKSSEGEWIERLIITPEVRKVPQAQRTKFEMSTFLCWRELGWVHGD